MSENPLDQLIKAVYSCPNLLPKVYEDYLKKINYRWNKSSNKILNILKLTIKAD
jgi:DNA-directed RNA polymerase subunit N (RpoN/RPB10)